MDEKINQHTGAGNGESEDFTSYELVCWHHAWNLQEEVRLIIACLPDLRSVAIDEILETEGALRFTLAFSLQFFCESLMGRFTDGTCAVLMSLLVDDGVHHPLVAPGE